MSIAELELKTQTFAADLSDEELLLAEEILEDLHDARAVNASVAGQYSSVSGEEMEAYLSQKFGFKFEPAL